ncbi:hypothetical protein Sme01_04180 [Sphaerisporangium melleum]|uniref:Uncharacterized protein n=1 Tax=Sphaerisporangium melleum TaxID=321316 RepID=A0A917VCW3_9ACTN|nr:hypothetical protein [Sphaerisporangium melleum]GGK62217.1 hypothetical protein GCM10007964_01730 [Sphaerisporangium melleum]GII67942.1 hypothetical protein Sme01_04180 [Sphaerisporangium melleum]
MTARTPLVDQIEALGRAVDDGLISRGEAVASLAEWSQGGLTELGAAKAIDDWKNMRVRYTSLYLDTVEAIERITRGLGGAQ